MKKKAKKDEERVVFLEKSYFAWIFRHSWDEVIGFTCSLHENALARYLNWNYHRRFAVWTEATKCGHSGWYSCIDTMGNPGESLSLPTWATVELQRFDCIHGGVQGPVTRRQYDQAITIFRDGRYEQLVAAYRQGDLTATQFERETGRQAGRLASGEEYDGAQG